MPHPFDFIARENFCIPKSKTDSHFDIPLATRHIFFFYIVSYVVDSRQSLTFLSTSTEIICRKTVQFRFILVHTEENASGNSKQPNK